MKQSELLRKQADMMDMAEKHGIDDWRKLVLVCGNEWTSCFDILYDKKMSRELSDWNDHKFALGVVEGRPVFEGDEVYIRNTKFTAGEVVGIYLCEVGYSKRGSGVSCYFEDCSWNPPKPKDIDVRMPIELAEYYASFQGNRMGEACRKALESIK